MSFRIRRLSHTLGAEVIGADIRKSLNNASFREIHAAFLEHGVLLFRGQTLTREQQIAFTSRFGKLKQNKLTAFGLADPEYPQILLVTHKPNPGKLSERYSGDHWHSDGSNTLVPDMASLLRSVQIPEVGGDTMFANMYLAYESLSDGMKKLVERLHGLHPTHELRVVHAAEERRNVHSVSEHADNDVSERITESNRPRPPIAQPMVKVHPETGRKALYVSEKVKQIAGMTSEESKPIVEFLCRHATRAQFIYRHQWQKDDVLMWDNRCTIHFAVHDFDKSQVRHMERTTVIGEPSGFEYEGTR